ncbi:ATP-binding protein [Micromonospora aurantiaca]|uniref:ATP-binding protein n=1 Tax=Micromonospora aurantiaca (nom. illeg.) TaxID=47850 RepID=UPI001E5C8C30|nr:ATP-binding protein [Micromonospora aurantiaca]UFN95300.1 restriction endonuclease [Micromonospora aurantiaca]
MKDGFENLSDYDFERLVADLLTAEWGVHVGSFPKGRDGGVDLRVLGPADGPLQLPAGAELVVQCKHRPAAIYRDIKSELSKEALKPIIDQVARYFVVTSARLTRNNKKSIVELFANRILEADVLGIDDLAALVRRHPEVQKATPKLWMSSGIVLMTLLHHIENLRSTYLRDELRRLRLTFVETGFVAKARELIEDLGICILAGPPGVGKTTTAHILLLQLMADGWEPITAIGDVRELEAQIAPGKRQVLFFDDFLGQNSLDAKLRVGGDAELVRLMRLVESDHTKIFIMTTRDYVLRQAQQSYERLASDIFDTTRITIKAESLTLHEKAHILYNQLYYSPLRFMASRAPSREYLAVAEHPKFNPRLTEAAIALLVRSAGLNRRAGRSSKLAGDQPQEGTELTLLDVPEQLLQALKRPEGLWDHVLRHQLTELQRDILLVRFSFGTTVIRVAELYEAVRKLYALDGRRCLAVDLDGATSVLDGDLLRLSGKDRSLATASGLNPGLSDAVEAFLLQYPEHIGSIARSAPYYEQVRLLAGLCGYDGRNQPPFGQQILPGLDDQLVRPTVLNPRRLDLEHDILGAVVRTLFDPGATAIGATLIPAKFPWYRRAAERLRCYLWICERTDAVPSKDIFERMVDEVLENIHRMPSEALLGFVRMLRPDIVEEWRPTRTRFEVGLLDYMSDPDDVNDWSILADIMDEVPVTDDFRSEMAFRFDRFAQAQLEELVSQLEDDPQGDEDATLDELKSVADQWNCSLDTNDAEELIEQQIERERAEAGSPEDPADSLWTHYKEHPRQSPGPQPGRLFDLL